MAKGASSKITVTNKILEAFPGSFVYGKEIRIPMNEDGVDLQIKVALTCAKDNVTQGEDNAIPGTVVNGNAAAGAAQSATVSELQPTAEEKANVSALLKTLGLAQPGA